MFRRHVHKANVDFDASDFSVLTQEQIQEYFRVAGEETEERERNKIKLIPRVRKEYIFPTSFKYNKDDVPEFIKLVFRDPYILTEEKDRFIELFVIPFIEIPSFKEEKLGKYLLFIDNKYVDGVISYVSELDEYKGSKVIIKIGEIDFFN